LEEREFVLLADVGLPVYYERTGIAGNQVNSWN
jgi:hypothetical protein